jgi:hypothetical protein
VINKQFDECSLERAQNERNIALMDGDQPVGRLLSDMWIHVLKPERAYERLGDPGALFPQLEKGASRNITNFLLGLG